MFIEAFVPYVHQSVKDVIEEIINKVTRQLVQLHYSFQNTDNPVASSRVQRNENHLMRGFAWRRCSNDSVRACMAAVIIACLVGFYHYRIPRKQIRFSNLFS
ncbi:hypothetical protein AVEN_233908-1 [Araneus ventricosus]|uniref:Uncharacterized protein n=1 Tax=Araneus ventricosus TaxID=182803 RepID=A0A4Y2X6E2_ARAVE|nr:hypothetical protein AVEN_233908-1 [Araneus ventricosus]